MLFQVCLINSENVVIHAGAEEAADANEAIEKARQWAQLPYCRAKAYDAYDDAYDDAPDAAPVLEKPCHAPLGHFRKIV